MEDERLLDNSRKPLVRAEDRRFITLNLDYLAVAKDLHGKGFGLQILANAVDVFHNVILSTGIPAMTLVCIDQEKVSFYQKLGFAQYGPQCNRPKMLLPALDVLAAYREELNKNVTIVIETENNA